MQNHITRMRRAIEFAGPAGIPLELVDVPHIYNAYDTLNPATVQIPAGAENFDSLWCTYHWTFQYLGRTAAGEPIRQDEWGCQQIVPRDSSTAYIVTEKPLAQMLPDLAAYRWPDPEKTNWFFESRQQAIARHYPDRFVCGFLDPGPFLIAFNLFGYDGLLLKMADDPTLVRELLRKIFDYQQALIPKFKAMGAHMVCVIDEVAGSGGMMFAPGVFRTQFLPMYRALFATIHRHNMYTACLLDGNITAILPDLARLEIDQQFFAQPLATGLNVIAEHFHGRRCVKLAVDMMTTLAQGTAAEITAQVDEYVKSFHTARGGLVFQALRWHRPTYAAVRVKAQLDAMNKYRSEV